MDLFKKKMDERKRCARTEKRNSFAFFFAEALLFRNPRIPNLNRDVWLPKVVRVTRKQFFLLCCKTVSRLRVGESLSNTACFIKKKLAE